MRVRNHGAGYWLLALFAVLSLLLGACGPTSATGTPSPSVQEIYTFAYQTLSAQQATQLALTPPTNTPSPTLAATLPPPSPIATLLPFASSTPGGGVSACDSSSFAGDVTIPDGTTIAPGKKFDKTWTLLNNGTCTWSTSYKLVFDSGDQMGGAATFVPASVPPGSVTNVTVSLTAPTANGTYKGTWRLQNANNQPFGDTPWVIIKVGAGSTATAGPSPTPGGDLVSISGSLGATEVTLDFSGATSIPTVTYTDQNYTFDVPVGWSGTITPSKGTPGHWSFDPASKSFVNVKSNKTQDFTATSITPTPK